MDVAIGSKLGGYTLIRKLGSGGMGAVYLAEDETIGQQVAIKVIRADSDAHVDAASEAHAAELFRREARAVASLDHLHILPLYRYGEEENDGERRAYMVMQYRPEGSLWDWLRKRASTSVQVRDAEVNQGSVGRFGAGGGVSGIGGLAETWPLGVEEVAEYVGQAASALQYAHERGIVHRDVKPANFLLRFSGGPPRIGALDLPPRPATRQAGAEGTRGEEPKGGRPYGWDSQGGSSQAFLLLSDFGLAKFYATTSASSTVFGTPTYMAPEQFEGEVGPESDQYALAIMVYYLLAGRPPFEGEPMRLMHQHLSVEPPPIRTFASEIPAGIENVLQRALAKKPGARYPSIIAFADAFKQHNYQVQQISTRVFTAGAPPLRTPTGMSDLARGGVPAGENESVGARDAAFAATIYEPGERPQQASGRGMMDDSAPTVLGGAAGGSSAAHAQPGQGAHEKSAPALHLPPHERRGPVNQPLFLQGEADNQGLRPEEMPVSRRGALGWIVGGAAVIATGAGASAYFYLNRKSSGGAIPQPISGTPTHRPISPGNSKHFVLTGHSGEVTGVAWGPGGTELASSSKDGTVRLWDIATRQTVQNYQGHHQPVFTVAWSPTGQQLASGGSSVQVWNPMGQITHGPFNLGGEVSNVVWQIDEANLFASTLKNDLHEIQLSTNKGELAEKGISRTAAISPDGKYLALGGSDGALSIFELPTLQRLTYIHQHASAVFGVAWSYDSRQLASASSDRTAKIWDIANHSSQTLPHNSAVLSISWEPGSSNRLATASANGALNIWTLASTGGTATHIPHIGHSGPCTTVAWGTKAIATGSMDKSIIIWTV